MIPFFIKNHNQLIIHQLMIITRRSPITGKENKIDINITQQQLERWRDGELIQDVAPELTPDEREFIITGNTKEDWEAMFGNDED
jgi:hypothetical protein